VNTYSTGRMRRGLKGFTPPLEVAPLAWPFRSEQDPRVRRTIWPVAAAEN